MSASSGLSGEIKDLTGRLDAKAILRNAPPEFKLSDDGGGSTSVLDLHQYPDYLI